MSATDILLIDHDDLVLGLLRGSIVGKNPGANIAIARNKTEAYLLFQFHKYQFIFCDYEILVENDYDLLNLIRSSQDSNTKIIVTCYDDLASLNFGTHPAPPLSLSKPIDQTKLNAILTNILAEKLPVLGMEINLSDETFQQIEVILKGLQRDINSRCIVVCNQDGRVLVQEGDTESIAVDAIASLVSGSIMTLEEVGHIFNDPTIINLAYREGTKSDLYVMNIGQKLMLIMILDKSVISPKIGTVWFYARPVAITIDQLIKNVPSVKKPPKNSAEEIA